MMERVALSAGRCGSECVEYSDLSHFNDELAYLNLSNHCVHAGPIIRSEEEYKGFYRSHG